MNNRGLIVKQYEPCFDSTYHFRDDSKHGISRVTSFYSTRTDFDISGNVRKIIDAQGRVIVCAGFDMCGNMLYHSTMDFGQEWFVNDISGKTVLCWEDHDIPIRTEYDALRRLVGRYRWV